MPCENAARDLRFFGVEGLRRFDAYRASRAPALHGLHRIEGKSVEGDSGLRSVFVNQVDDGLKEQEVVGIGSDASSDEDDVRLFLIEIGLHLFSSCVPRVGEAPRGVKTCSGKIGLHFGEGGFELLDRKLGPLVEVDGRGSKTDEENAFEGGLAHSLTSRMASEHQLSFDCDGSVCPLPSRNGLYGEREGEDRSGFFWET